MTMTHALKQKAKQLEPALRLGKKGITEAQVKEIKQILKKKKLIKIRLVKGYLEGKDRKAEARHIAELADARLIDAIGFVVVLARKN